MTILERLLLDPKDTILSNADLVQLAKHLPGEVCVERTSVTDDARHILLTFEAEGKLVLLRGEAPGAIAPRVRPVPGHYDADELRDLLKTFIHDAGHPWLHVADVLKSRPDPG